MYYKDGKSSAYMSVHENGACLLHLKGKDGYLGQECKCRSMARWRIREVYWTNDKDGGRLAQISIDEYGGSVSVYGRGNAWPRCAFDRRE